MSIQKLGISSIKQCANRVKSACTLTFKPIRLIPSSHAGKLAAAQKDVQRFVITDKEFRLISPDGDILSSLFYMKEKDAISIMDMSSNKVGCGYGTALLQKFTEMFKNTKIKVCACWERFVSPKPPHKFYMRNGFVPTNKEAETVLKAWVAKGGNPQDFPLQYELCEMLRMPQ